MTSSSYVISNSQTTTETLNTSYDDLLVTSAGSIIVTTSDGVGVDATAGSQEITIDGLVYSLYAYENIGVEITGVGTALNVNGQVQGDDGVEVDEGTSERVSVGTQGVIDGDGDGVIFLGNFSDPAATDNTLDNAGDVSGGPGVGVLAEEGGGDAIDNSGQISGEDGVSLGGNAATETVENSGTITGGVNGSSPGSAIFTTGSSAGIAVVNSGLLTNSGANAIDTGAAVLYFDDESGTTSTIDNTGSISGSGYVIQSLSDILDISNSGTIHGGLYSTATVDVDTSGVWKDQAGSPAVFLLDGGNNSVTNAASGEIDGSISAVHSHDTFNNAGSIDGSVFIASGSDTFTNTGAINGEIMFSGSETGNTLTNSGDITGSIALSAASSFLTNYDQIYGDVVLAGSDTLTNTGTIHGNVFLSDNDTFAVSPGIVTGAIYASTVRGSPGDLFEFSGNFGQVTFDDFVGSTGTNHDTIQFAANDFGTFSQVENASSQIGSDVVIRLDATDSITLNNVAVSSLVSADFTFV